MTRPRAVITGLGVVSPVGLDVPTFWDANIKGRSGLSREIRVDTSELPCGFVSGSFSDADLAILEREWARPGRSWPEALLCAAIDQAVREAGLDGGGIGRPALVTAESSAFVGANAKGFATYERLAQRAAAAGAIDREHGLAFFEREGTPETFFFGSQLETEIAARLGRPLVAAQSLEGTCATGLHVVADAARLIETGRADVVIAAASSSRITPYILGTYSQLMALSRWNGEPALASRPFDRNRDGMVLAEAAGCLVLESENHAARRGVTAPYARIGGYGFATSIVHPTAPSPEHVAKVFQLALERSGRRPSDIDVINAHGTSTRLNDLTESRALHEVFGSALDGASVCACKSILGHSSIAASMVESVAVALTFRDNLVPPVPTTLEPDPDCQIRTSVDPIERPVNAVLKNAFGFGGQYGSMVFLRA